MNEWTDENFSLEVNVNPNYFTVKLACPRCGYQMHQCDRRICKEITLGDFLSRVMDLHSPHVTSR